jgi:hypothetical protein
MSTKPSWLDDEENQNAAKSIAQNPVVQQAAIKQAKAQSPSWATEEYKPPTVPGAEPTKNDKPETPQQGSGAFVCDPEELKEMKKWHNILRCLYIIAAIFLSVIAGVTLAAGTTAVSKIFFCFYILFFCTIMCCFEVALQVFSNSVPIVLLRVLVLQAVTKLIATNFGFLYTFSGRCAFILFLGFMSFSLSLWGKVAMAFLYAVFAFHLYIGILKFPR